MQLNAIHIFKSSQIVFGTLMGSARKMPGAPPRSGSSFVFPPGFPGLPGRAAMAPPVRRRLGSRIEAQLTENSYSWQKLGETQGIKRHDLAMKDIKAGDFTLP